MTMSRVLPNVYLGTLEDAEQLAFANPRQISTVISLCREPVEERSPEVCYLQFPVIDNRAIPLPLLNAIVAAMERYAREGAVLLHCPMGISRSPAILAAYLDHIGFRRYREALRFLATIRPQIDPSPVLVRSIARELD